jgi:hypothetical protein
VDAEITDAETIRAEPVINTELAVKVLPLKIKDDEPVILPVVPLLN